MKIDGLGTAMQPEYLAPYPGNGEVGDKGDEDSIEETTPKLHVPQVRSGDTMRPMHSQDRSLRWQRKTRKCTRW